MSTGWRQVRTEEAALCGSSRISRLYMRPCLRAASASRLMYGAWSQIRRLAELRGSGAITPDGLEAKKRDLLHRM